MRHIINKIISVAMFPITYTAICIAHLTRAVNVKNARKSIAANPNFLIGIGDVYQDTIIVIHNNLAVLAMAGLYPTEFGCYCTKNLQDPRYGYVVYVNDCFVMSPKHVQEFALAHEFGHIVNGDIDIAIQQKMLVVDAAFEKAADSFAAFRVRDDVAIDALTYIRERISHDLTATRSLLKDRISTLESSNVVCANM